jgi:hypothetical protein
VRLDQCLSPHYHYGTVYQGLPIHHMLDADEVRIIIDHPPALTDTHVCMYVPYVRNFLLQVRWRALHGGDWTAAANLLYGSLAGMALMGPALRKQKRPHPQEVPGTTSALPAAASPALAAPASASATATVTVEADEAEAAHQAAAEAVLVALYEVGCPMVGARAALQVDALSHGGQAYTVSRATATPPHPTPPQLPLHEAGYATLLCVVAGWSLPRSQQRRHLCP